MRRREPRAHLEYQELLYLEPDGELAATEVRELAAHLEKCVECRSVRADITSLSSLMARSKVEPHPDFAVRVLTSLPAADWEMRRPASWRLAAAAFVGLLGAAYLLTVQGQTLGEALPWMGTLAVLAELFRSAALAGAGLLSASWAGVGLALGDVLSQSRVGLVVFGLFVLGVDVLFLRYVWRLSHREAGVDATGRPFRGKSA